MFTNLSAWLMATLNDTMSATACSPLLLWRRELFYLSFEWRTVVAIRPRMAWQMALPDSLLRSHLARRQVIFPSVPRRLHPKIEGLFPNGIGQAWQISWNEIVEWAQCKATGKVHMQRLSKTTPPRPVKHSGCALTVSFRPRASSWAAQSCIHCLPATAWVQPVSTTAVPLGRLCAIAR